jgi:hypothetical protein
MNEICLSLVLGFGIFFGTIYGGDAWATEQVSKEVSGQNLILKADLLDKKSESLLYRFTRVEPGVGFEPTELKKIVRTFTDPSGQIVAAEEVFYQSERLTKIVLDHKQLNESGELEVKDDKLIFKYTRGGKQKVSEEKYDPTLTAVDQIYPTILKNWKELLQGKTIPIRLPVLDRRETVGFKFFKEKDAQLKGKDVIVIKMKPSSFFIAAIVDPILFYFDKTEIKSTNPKLIQVVGRTVPKIKEGSSWRDLDAILRFE